MKKHRSGALGTVQIALENVTPAKQNSDLCDIAEIAWRSEDKPYADANYRLGIATAHGSCEALLENYSGNA